MKMFNRAMLLLAVAIAFSLTSCTQDSELTSPNEEVTFRSRGQNTPPAGPTIVDVASGNPDFSILVDAVIRAGLVDALSGNGPFTVFAPTNDAFVALLNTNGFASLDDVPVDVLTTILKTHVLAGELEAADLSTGYYNTLARGVSLYSSDIYINLDNGVTINGSVNVVATDISASNGVIHVIDAVINPSDIVTLAASNPVFSSLVAALTRPDLSIDFVGALNSGEIFTVLAPTNTAFQALLDSNPDWNTLGDIPVDVLEAVLSYHVAPGVNYTARALKGGRTVNTLLQGATYSTEQVRPSGLRIIAGSNTANVVATDVQARNGVIHAIDTVILP